MSNFQSKAKEAINTAAVAGALYKDTPELQFKDMGEAVKRLYPGENGQSKTDISLQQAEVADKIYGVQWERNKIAQERITKLLKKADKELINKADPELKGEKFKSFIDLVSRRNRIAGQFGLSPMNVNDYIGKSYEEEQNARLDATTPEPYHVQTKTDDKGHRVYPTVSKSKQPDWNTDMIKHGQDRYQGKKADAMRTVLQRRFAKIPNPMTVAQFKGGPEW